MNFGEKLRENPVFELVAGAAGELGAPAYVVGGYVRDLILGRPCKDIDFVCVGSGIALAEKAARRYKPGTHVASFKNFGTAMFVWGDSELEFVGARRESYHHDSRKPVVEDGTLEDDQNRRDFTINALAISLNSRDFGQLIDPFNGLEDLRRKIIRTPLAPDITFSDDPLRMMRAVRFATQLGFDIHPDTFDAIQRNAERIRIVSMERISTELNKIILSSTPSYGFKLLYHAGLLDIIFPEFVELRGAEERDGKSHKDNFYHTLQVLDNVSKMSPDLWLRWAAVLHDIAKPATKRFHKDHGWTFHGHEDKGARMVPELFRRFKLPLDGKMRFVQKLVRLHLRPIALVKDTVTDSAVRRLLFETGDDFEALMMLCRADVTTKDGNRFKRYLENFKKVEKRAAQIEEADSIRNFQPAITGEIIMELFDLKPSREVGVIKTYLREAILDGRIPNRLAEGYDFVQPLAKKMNLIPVMDREAFVQHYQHVVPAVNDTDHLSEE